MWSNILFLKKREKFIRSLKKKLREYSKAIQNFIPF